MTKKSGNTENAHGESLVVLDRNFHDSPRSVHLDGASLTMREILGISRHKARVDFSGYATVKKRMDKSYSVMMKQVHEGVPIYGCNTGYGAQAKHVVARGDRKTRLKNARAISESIVHTDIGVGPELPAEITRAAIAIRVNMLARGVSAVRIEDLDILIAMLNNSVTPVVHAYGGLGASGDLAHNSRVLSAARQILGVQCITNTGRRVGAARHLKKLGIKKLVLEPKAGLAFVNGDNFSTAAAALLVSDMVRYSLIADVAGAMMIEVLKGTTRSFHPFLGSVRQHPGHNEVSKIYRYLLKGSMLARDELSGHLPREVGVSVQDAYSLRAIPQTDGFNREQIAWALQRITVNANSVSDNPLWVPPEYTMAGERPWQWISGGNFMALHMAEIIDAMRKIMTRLIKRNDRHLHRMVSSHESNGLPANLSDRRAISQSTFKGFQLQSGMFDVYSMVLAQPVTTLFGIYEESNQDITTHSMTSAILAWENLKLLRYSLAMNLVAVAQAVDLRGGPAKLSPRTRPVYRFVRKHVSYVKKERPLNTDIEIVARCIEAGEVSKILRDDVFSDYS